MVIRGHFEKAKKSIFSTFFKRFLAWFEPFSLSLSHDKTFFFSKFLREIIFSQKAQVKSLI